MGDILFFDYYSSISRRDGTFECVIVYRELSEAQLAAKLDGTELGDRCLEVRLSQSIDRFDISFGSNGVDSGLGSRTLLIKSEDMSCGLEQISNDFEGIFRSIELERDLGAGLPPLSARFFLIEFATMEAAESALKHPNFTVAEAQRHMQSFTIGTGTATSASSVPQQTSTEEVLIYGVPASKLLDPTTLRSKSSSYNTDDKTLKSSSASYRSRSKSRSRSRSPRRHRSDHHHYRGREKYDDYDRYRRDRKRSRSRSGGERRRRQ